MYIIWYVFEILGIHKDYLFVSGAIPINLAKFTLLGVILSIVSKSAGSSATGCDILSPINKLANISGSSIFTELY